MKRNRIVPLVVLGTTVFLLAVFLRRPVWIASPKPIDGASILVDGETQAVMEGQTSRIVVWRGKHNIQVIHEAVTIYEADVYCSGDTYLFIEDEKGDIDGIERFR